MIDQRVSDHPYSCVYVRFVYVKPYGKALNAGELGMQKSLKCERVYREIQRGSFKSSYTCMHRIPKHI
jgi:hypothetical protein